LSSMNAANTVSTSAPLAPTHSTGRPSRTCSGSVIAHHALNRRWPRTRLPRAITRCGAALFRPRANSLCLPWHPVRTLARPPAWHSHDAQQCALRCNPRVSFCAKVGSPIQPSSNIRTCGSGNSGCSIKSRSQLRFEWISSFGFVPLDYSNAVQVRLYPTFI
jgi:hypothetical protein